MSRRAPRRASEAAVPTPDAALAVGLGGRAAGGPHLDPPLAVGVVVVFPDAAGRVGERPDMPLVEVGHEQRIRTAGGGHFHQVPQHVVGVPGAGQLVRRPAHHQRQRVGHLPPAPRGPRARRDVAELVHGTASASVKYHRLSYSK